MHPEQQLLIAHDRIRERHDEAARDRLAHEARIHRTSQAARSGPLRGSKRLDLGGATARFFGGRIRRPAFLRPAGS